MKKSILSLSIVSVFSLFMISCNSKEDSKVIDKNEETSVETKAQYTCPMHTEVLADEPGSCPKCGMALEKKKAE